ncbi:glycoside hydrolase family 32 protein [Paenibacillus sabinae]|uniref:Levanase n=1 Tax=Paenibacillus sabinae T27 TaxID=1268072 RepID=X4Z814_9BACL|nr:glycoside hydrolase family 32 protein [Paenibacillus sabinae]AHV95826.1 levanase [Paenibacillus sabinae T27]
MTETYHELYRPQYHLTPPEGPMSDPNGMVFYEGEYHQFYQFTGRWGHAVSRDLLHWEHLPLALVTDDLGDIWSGSAVVDWNDSSGFFGGGSGLVAIFTHFKDGLQSQSIAYSPDKGRTWVKYSGNPVIPNPGLNDFRDPKVLWHEQTGRWAMAVSVDRAIHFYSSPNLRDWQFESVFEGTGCQDAVWECPDLFQLPVLGEPGQSRWVLHVSIGDNEVTDGSTAQYFVGHFDGRRFVCEHEGSAPRWTDYGQDFYAAVSYSDIPWEDGRTIWLGWTSNWQYPFHSPTEPWKGGMSIPRTLVLARNGAGELHLAQQPVQELENLREEPVRFGPLEVKDEILRLPFSGLSYEFEAEVSWDRTAEWGIRVRVSDDGEQHTVLGFSPEREELFLDRRKSGFSELPKRTGGTANFAKVFRAPRSGEDGRLFLRGFVDDSVIEWFVGDGEEVFTSLVYPRLESGGLELFARGGNATFSHFTVYPLKSVWT